MKKQENQTLQTEWQDTLDIDDPNKNNLPLREKLSSRLNSALSERELLGEQLTQTTKQLAWTAKQLIKVSDQLTDTAKQVTATNLRLTKVEDRLIQLGNMAKANQKTLKILKIPPTEYESILREKSSCCLCQTLAIAYRCKSHCGKLFTLKQ